MRNKMKERQRSVPRIVSKFPGWDDFAGIFFFLAVLGTFLFELLVVCRHLYPVDLYGPLIHGLIGTFLLHNIIGNFIMIIRYESTIRGKIMVTSFSSPSSSQANSRSRICMICETTSPPRSHHCLVCNVCVLKRDHHCTFAKTCIGYSNYRYYLPLCLHLSIGAFYATILNMLFIWNLLGGFNIWNLLAHTFPFIFWTFGKLPLYHTFCCIISVINIAGCLFSLGLLLYHGSMVFTNQTVHEKNKGIDIYDLGSWKMNVYHSLGSNWALVWLSPFIPSKLPGNGQNFPTRTEFKLNSSKNK
ncbi:putative palmitoyltransferase ZDHHC24 [Brevipalpus obovatus]|uniref:putative palmitoyltransferase ZDHHC24 n=1 Tax=Brevipalpus obovatus TaxID=246614 RepID=UPI003D9EE342